MTTVAESMRTLDDPDTYARLDVHQLGPVIAALGEQILEAWEHGQAWPMPAHFRTPERVVIAGMGGSAIGGDIAATLVRRSSTIPVEVVRNYTGPPTTAATLTIANSMSGNTEETVAALEHARLGPGMRMTISKGGKLAEFDEPRLHFEWPHPPRTGLGWNLFPLLAVLERLNVLTVDRSELEATSAALRDLRALWGPDVPTADNRAKQIALDFQDRLPVILGVEFLEVVARRWAGEIQENAKQWAFWAALPEMNHNLLNGIAHPDRVDQLRVVILDAETTHPRNSKRATLTVEELDAVKVESSIEVAGGSSPLESIMRAIYLGDWVSYYLAMLNGEDPFDTRIIDSFKVRMNDAAAGK